MPPIPADKSSSKFVIIFIIISSSIRIKFGLIIKTYILYLREKAKPGGKVSWICSGLTFIPSIAAYLPGAEVTICSVCQSAVNKLHKNRHRNTALRTKTRDALMLGGAKLLWKTQQETTIKWVKGHAEKDEADASLWTREM